MPELKTIPKQIVQKKPFNKAAYQDSLLKIYPNERTIEIINDDYKKITKVIINREHLVTIYLKVEHKWGGVFFFIDNTPFPLENISKSYFEVATRLLSEKPKTEPKTRTQVKTPIKTQAKPVQNKTGSKAQKK